MILVSAGDSITAKLIKEAGFDGIWISGFESCARLGIPDNGSISLDQMLYIAEPIVKATDLPVYVDVDTGYGDIVQTIRSLESIGVKGISVEDVVPEHKQNSLWGDKIPLLPAEEFAEKINVKRNLEIIARTEAFVRGYGEEETWRRMDLYQKAGADWLLPHSRTFPLTCPNDGKWAIVPTKFPQFHNYVLESMGYDMIIWANQTCRTQIKAVRRMLRTLNICGRMLEADRNLCATLEDMRGLI